VRAVGSAVTGTQLAKNDEVHPIRSAVRLLGAVALAALIATSLPSFAVGSAAAAASLAAAKALDLGVLDPSCKACDDFYQFATGGWLKGNPIPPGHAAWGAAAELTDQNRAVLNAILQDAAKVTNAPAGSDTQKLGSFYRACMDEDGIEKAGTAPIAALLAGVDGVSSMPALIEEIGRLHQAGIDGGITFGSGADTKDSSKQIATLNMGGMGLPDRDYYLKDDPRFVAIRATYRAYVAAQLANLGEAAGDAAGDAGTIVALETAIAQATPPREALRDPAATYHPMGIAQLSSLAPHIPWPAYFATYGAPAFTTIDVSVPSYVAAYDALVLSTPPSTWKAYLRYKIADSYAVALPKRFADAQFSFRGTTLTGVKEQLPRDQRCTAAADMSLRDVLGKVYVAKAFSPAAKARALALVNNLQSVLRDDIKTLDWMSAPTKVRAIEKLDAFTKKIGYPDTWVDYSALTIADGPYASDVIAVRRFQSARTIARIGKPTDRTLFAMTPSTVNAYYSPTGNEIVFPAGILQPPYFNPAADDAVNYGAAGAVIGHEMTHGFDDQGRQFDGKGDLSDWWTPADAAAFKGRAQCIVDEYNGLEPIPGVHENGVNVQGEAIADLGGLTIAYKAFERTPQAKAHAMIDGYTPEQRFFLAYAQVWRGSQTEAAIHQAAITDVHPNPKLRVLGTLSNMPEFRAAFACAADAPMVRKQSCQIW
jgi:putative endopeptidase